MITTEAFEHERTKMVTRRGRVTERVAGWTPEAMTRFAFHAADRSVRMHAPRALRAAGFGEEADQLEALPAIDSHVAARFAMKAMLSVYDAVCALYSTEQSLPVGRARYITERAGDALGRASLAERIESDAPRAALNAAETALRTIEVAKTGNEHQYLSRVITGLISA